MLALVCHSLRLMCRLSDIIVVVDDGGYVLSWFQMKELDIDELYVEVAKM